MTSTETIDKAIATTLKEHPDFVSNFSSIITMSTINGVNPTNYTSKENARQSVRDMRGQDVLKYILDEAAHIYGAILTLYPRLLTEKKISHVELAELDKTFPSWKIIFVEIENMKNANTNLLNDYYIDKNRIFHLTNAVMSIRFNNNFYPLNVNSEEQKRRNAQGEEFRRKIDRLGKNIHSDFVKKKINFSYQQYQKIKDLKINARAVNQCLQEVLNGTQITHARNEYALDGTLFATQDIGKRRKNQEDSTLIMVHPANPNFKLIAVADGMGGGIAGEEVSNYTVRALSEWFESLPISYYENYEQLYPEFQKVACRISNDIYRKYNEGRSQFAGSTLIGAIVGKEVTTILNIGDSRAYAISGGNINLLTEDESQVWLKMKMQVRDEVRSITRNDINELRFAPENNKITSAIGFQNLSAPQVRLMYNDSYDKLLLFSDGVHDLLSMEDIKVIAQSTPPEEITKAIVEAALVTPARKYDKRGNVIQEISAGKDNATAAAYIRR